MADKPTINHGKYFLTLVFASIFLVSLGAVSYNVFAMGQNGCTIEYDGPFTSFTINNGSKTFDALANPGVTLNSYGSINVTFVIHTPNVNSENNSNSGATWFGDDFYGYENGHCIGPVGPNQNVTVSETLSKTHTYGGYAQSITFGTRASSGATFNVQWLSSPSIPQNLQATANDALVTLTWSAPSNNGGSSITNYKIYKSTSSGTETLFATTGNVTSYNDTSVTNGQTYFYKVTAVNSVGESTQSNETSATPMASTDQVVATVPLGNQHPSEIGVNPSTNKIYVSNIGTDTVSIINGLTYSVVNNIPVGSGPWSVAVNPSTNKIYVGNSHNNTVSVIDGNTDSVVATISVGSVSEVTVNPNTNKIYVSDYTGKLYVINGTTDTIMNTIPIVSTAYGVAVNPNTNKIYVGNYRNGTVSVIDGNTDSVVATISVGNEPEDIGVNPTTNKIYVPNYFDSTVSVIDGFTNSVVATIQVGSGPEGVAVNPATNKIYVSNTSGNSASIINGATDSIVATVRVGYVPQGVAVNPNTNKIYVANHGVYCGSAPGCTETPQPGSVSVIDGGSSNTSTTPSSPQNLTVSPVSSSTITMMWGTPASDGGSPIVGYKIERSTDLGSTWNTIVSNTNSTSNGYTDTGLKYRTGYTYRVSAINSAGTSAPSNTATGTTYDIYSSSPTGLTANTASSSQINLSWTTPSYGGTSPITGYKIERSNNTGTTWSTVQPNTTSTSTIYNDTGLVPSTTYTYRVSAINSAGASSPSNTAAATTRASTPPAGIILNNIQSTSGTASSSPYQITLANFNAGTSSNQLLVVGVSANNNNVVSVTFGGVQLTKKVSSFSNNDAEFWYLKNPSSAGNIVVTMAGSTSAVVGAYSFSGVNQSSPLPTSTTNHNSAASSPTVSLTTTNPNDWVLDLPSIYGGVTLGSPTCTQQWNTHMLGAITGASSSTVQTTAGSVTCKWTASSGEMWDDVAVEVKASGTGSGNTPTAPSSPTGLAASAASSSQINLSWTAPANSGGATITGYKIERSTDSGSTWSSLVSNTGNSSTKYSDTGLSPSTSYTYRVSAINSAGSSAPSNISSTTTPSNMTVPSPPTGLATTAVSSSQINLSWTAPSSNGGSAITGYNVQRSVNNGNTWFTVVSNTGSTNTVYNDTGLAPSTTYTYRVSAINSVGTSSPSNVSSATTSMVTTSGGITLTNVQSTSSSTSPSNPIMLADFNVGTGNNRLLVVGISADNSNAASVTFGGVPLTKKVSTFSNNDAEFWYLKNPTGTGAIVVTMSGSTSAIVGAYSFSGVNQSSPLPTSLVNHNSAASSPTVSLTTKFANDWVLDLPSIYGGVTLGSPTCTQQWNTNMPGAITGASSSEMVSYPSSVTCKWTASGADLWDDAAIEIAASK